MNQQPEELPLGADPEKMKRWLTYRIILDDILDNDWDAAGIIRYLHAEIQKMEKRKK